MSTNPTANYGTIPTPPTASSSSSYPFTNPVATSSSSSPFTTRAILHARTLLSYHRPWKEFLSISSLSLPSSYSDSLSRIRRNLNYFRYNYALIVLLIVFLSLLWHPVSMIVFLLVFLLWVFLYFFRDGPMVIFQRTVDDRWVLAGLGVVTVVALVLTSVGLNVLVALAVAVVLVGLHAALRGVEELFLSEDDAVEGGLASVVEEGQPLRPTRRVM